MLFSNSQKLTLLSTEPMKDGEKIPGSDFESAIQMIKDGTHITI